LSKILDGTTFLFQICEHFKKDPLAINIQGQLMNHHQVHDFSNNHAKFKFQDGLFCCDGILCVLNGPTQLQILQVRHDALATSHFGFNKTMKLVS
jgi:hypothetical protein